MPRTAAPVPTPDWVTPEGLAQRASFAADEPLRSKPVLVLTNPTPIDRGLIGYPRPNLIASNDFAIEEMAMEEWADEQAALETHCMMYAAIDDDNPNVGG